jgi:hypothetical protein
MPDRSGTDKPTTTVMEHNPFCSAGSGTPCPIGCESWPKYTAEMFPNLRPSPCPSICPVHRLPDSGDAVGGGPGHSDNPPATETA